jgi:hypothetical protein
MFLSRTRVLYTPLRESSGLEAVRRDNKRFSNNEIIMPDFLDLDTFFDNEKEISILLQSQEF